MTLYPSHNLSHFPAPVLHAFLLDLLTYPNIKSGRQRFGAENRLHRRHLPPPPSPSDMLDMSDKGETRCGGPVISSAALHKGSKARRWWNREAGRGRGLTAAPAPSRLHEERRERPCPAISPIGPCHAAIHTETGQDQPHFDGTGGGGISSACYSAGTWAATWNMQ